MKEFLLALILAGAGLHISTSAERQEIHSDVKYKGPVVYTNLPPPVLYFPKFPENPKLSNRGSSGDTEDKRVEYVPFPYKDLPLLVYQSDNQPPVHVVEKNSNQNLDKEDSGQPQHNAGYQTGPALYRVSDNNQYDNQEADSTERPQAVIANSNEKFINVGLSTSQMPTVVTPNQQYISIGVTSIQPQPNDVHNQQSSMHPGPSHAQAGGIYNQVQYSSSQNVDQVHYSPQGSESVSQSGPALVYYPNQYSSHNADSQVPVEQITQAIQNYLLQQNAVHVQAQSGIQQALISYPNKQESYASPPIEGAPSQHVGITIIRQPTVPDVPEHGRNNAPEGPHISAPPQIRHPPVQMNQGYEDNQQYVSIGVFPINIPGNDYGPDTQQYYNVITPVANNQYPSEDYRHAKQSYQNMNDDYTNAKQPYQNMNDDYRNVNDDYRNVKQPYQSENDDYRNMKQPYQNMNDDYRNPKQPYQNMNEDYRQNSDKPVIGPNDNSQTTGYQVISIDLSTLRNQHAEQQRNAHPEYNQQPQKPVEPPPPPPQNYRHPDEKGNSYGGREKEFQQILIQIPHNILSEQSDKNTRPRGPNETPYTGTAQVANVLGSASKVHQGHVINGPPVYNRPPPQKPQPPGPLHSERARNPNEAFNFPQNGINGINIAIIKQTDSSNNSPVFKASSEKRPHYHSPSIRTPNHPNPIIHRIPQQSFSHGPQRPMFGQPSKAFPPNNIKFHSGREPPIVSRTPFIIPATRYQHRQNFGPYRNRNLVQNFGAHPGVFASSNLHFTTVNPSGNRPQFFGNALQVPPPQMSFPRPSAKKNYPKFASNPGDAPVTLNAAASEVAVPSFANNIPNSFGDINFDEINAFLNPNYDLFGSMTSGLDKKKVEEETKFLQKVTTDLLTQDLNAASIAAAVPPPFVVKPPASALNVPFPYKYWEQPIRNFGPPGMVAGGDRTRPMNYYSHLQHPNTRGTRPFPSLVKGTGRKRGLGKGYRGLKSKLSALRSSIRGKSKIAPRLEEASEDNGNIESSVSKIASLIARTKTFGNTSPRSTIIKTERPGLDGISIPLNSEHVLSSRISTEEDENLKSNPMPPIIVYKGFNPPVEIYGSKDDIEKSPKSNETEKSTSEKAAETVEATESSTEKSESQSSEESAEANSGEGAGYIDYMYSMLPDLIRGSLNRRHDGDNSKWLPVAPVEYALAEDSYDRNETTTSSPVRLESVKESGVSQNSSSSAGPSIKEDIAELFSLLVKEEKSDLVKE